MRKVLLFLSVFLLSVSSVAANCGMMEGCDKYSGGCGMMGGYGSIWMPLLGLVYLAIGSFVFSVVFWAVHGWLVKPKKR